MFSQISENFKKISLDYRVKLHPHVNKPNPDDMIK